MRPILLSHERRARAWFDAAPPSSRPLAGPAARYQRIDVGDNRIESRKMATVELFVPLGGRFMYAVLGCEAVGVATSTLDILVPTFGERKDRFSKSLAGDLDTVWWGLPDEYCDAVLQGAIAGLQGYGAPRVQSIRFSVAAHGEVGSTASIFERLATLLMALLTAPRQDTIDLAATLERLLAR